MCGGSLYSLVWPSPLVVLAFNFIGDWLRDTMDPKLRQSR